jgi:hypothetical protein
MQHAEHPGTVEDAAELLRRDFYPAPVVVKSAGAPTLVMLMKEGRGVCGK